MMTATERLDFRLKRAGWTLAQALENPEERWPVPSPPYPPNRFYHLVADRTIALIVDEHGEVAGSIPGREAWDAVQQYSPHLTKAGPGKPDVIKHNGHGGWVLPGVDMNAPWMVQTVVTQEGAWTIHAMQDGGGAVLLNQELVCTYSNAEELEDREDISDIVLEAAWLIQHAGRPRLCGELGDNHE